jgi:hypothetical protein
MHVHSYKVPHCRTAVACGTCYASNAAHAWRLNLAEHCMWHAPQWAVPTCSRVPWNACLRPCAPPAQSPGWTSQTACHSPVHARYTCTTKTIIAGEIQGDSQQRQASCCLWVACSRTQHCQQTKLGRRETSGIQVQAGHGRPSTQLTCLLCCIAL